MSRREPLNMCIRTIAELILLSLIPALPYGCSSTNAHLSQIEKEEHFEYTVNLRSDDGDEPEHIDLFVFNNDELQRIDAYQRVTGGSVKAASRVGEKILVAIANSPCGMDDWRRIGSYAALAEELSLLADEDPDNPIMSAQLEINAGASETYDLALHRIMSKVHIDTICADFIGTEYEGEPFTDVKIYLTNVNASCTIMKEEDFRPEMLVNQGRLDLISIRDFKSAEMLYKEIPSSFTPSITYLDADFYCYPNNAEEETYSSPFTRLVIEGQIGGITCYYPIPINREENGVCFGTDGGGIGRNCLYEFNISLTRFGTSDPDIPVNKGDVVVNCRVLPFTEKDGQTIIY
ncbi:MAG: hypothetical protein LUD72_02415 [Bacteroidales bacterium]|nr:hypothetical protein [Bacteroidales bacterium]